MTGAGEMKVLSRTIAEQKVLESIARQVNAEREACSPSPDTDGDAFTSIGFQRAIAMQSFRCSAQVLERARQIAKIAVADADTDGKGVTKKELAAAIAAAQKAYDTSSASVVGVKQDRVVHSAFYGHEIYPFSDDCGIIMKSEGYCF